MKNKFLQAHLAKVINFLFLIMFAFFNGQTTIFQENFEGFTNGTLGTSTNTTTGFWSASVTAACNNKTYWGVYDSGSGIINNRGLKVTGVGASCAVSPGSYTTSIATTNLFAYTTMVTTGYQNITLDFDWKCAGETGTAPTVYDYGQVVYRVGTTGTWLSLAFGGNPNYPGKYVGMPAATTTHATLSLPAAVADQGSIQFGFRWDNDTSAGAAPSFSIDNIIVKGNLISTCAVPTGLSSNTVTATTANISWTAPSSPPANGYEYYLSTSATAPISTTTPTGTTGSGVVTKALTGLSSNTTYYFWVRSNCSTTSKSAWVGSSTFTTLQTPAVLDYSDGFEGTNNWTLINGAQTNKWFISNFVNNGGTKSLYISNTTTGTNNNYTILNAASVSHAYRDIAIPAGVNSVDVNFDWRAVGEADVSGFYDYLNVWMVPVNYAPVAGSGITAAAGRILLIGNLYGKSTFVPSLNPNVNVSTFAGQTMRLVFEWKNDDNTGTQTAAAVDNVVVKLASCNPVTASASKAIICPGEAVTLTATTISTGYTYNWYKEWNQSTGTGTLVGTGVSIVVNPTRSEAYRVVATKAGCNVYSYVVVAVSSLPTAITVSPESVVNCTSEVKQLSLTGGGVIPNIIHQENFNDLSAVAWLTSSTTTPVISTPEDANWMVGIPPDPYYTGWNGADGTSFAIADSDYVGELYGDVAQESILFSPPMSFQDYSAISLSFQHHLKIEPGYVTTAKVEVSTNGGVDWTTVQTYSNNIGGVSNFVSVNLNLNAYAGQPYVLIRFRYNATYDWWWAIDNVSVTGTPLATSVTWSPLAGLYTDAAKTTAYTGGNTATVYASPTTTTTYTVSAKTAVGCPADKTVVVTKGDADWNGATANWSAPANWVGNTVPTAEYCVNIPSKATKPVIQVGVSALAKNLTIQAGGSLDVKGNLTVTDFIKNKGAAGDLTIQSDANLIQINPIAANEGSVVVKRNINFSTGRNQYNYLISPVKNMGLKDIYKDASGNPVNVPFVLYHNEATNMFYNSSGAYIAGRALAVKEASGSVFAPGVMSATFTGEAMNGNLSYILVNSNISDPNRGYNLIGNPYPSNFDLNAFYGANSTDLSPTFNLWDSTANTTYEQQGNQYGGQAYAQWNAVLPPGVGSGVKAKGDVTTSKNPTQYVKVGQGFITKSLVSTKTVNFTNTMRTPGTAEAFFGKEVVSFDRYRLNLTSPANLTSEIAVVYFAGGNDGYTSEDSRSLLGSDAIYSIVDGQPVSINGKNSFVNTDVVKLGVNPFAAGNYTIALENQKDGVFANGQNIYLKDKQTGIVTNLSAGSYTFTANAGESTGRFEIIYLPATVLATEGDVKEDLSVYRDGSDFIVKAHSSKITALDVYDAVGRLVLSMKPDSVKVTVPAEQIVNGVYVLKIDQSGKITTKKVIR